jgi:hypothetical protein
MWIPADTAAIEDAARRDDLEETPSFDAKRELPASPKKNIDVAIDVAAMSTEGGVLLYGIAEDDNKRPTILAPFPLAGAADRIGEIVAKSIAEVPYIDVREYRTEDDEAIGYLAVIVPQSARAPHQVTVGDDRRFYGRGAKGNRRLSEGEIALLYQRRQDWEQDRESLLGDALAQAPYGPQAGLANLIGFVRPVAPDRGIWDRAIAFAGGRDELRKRLSDAAGSSRVQQSYSPNFIAGHWTRQGADDWRLSSQSGSDHDDPKYAQYLVAARLNVDGRGHLFCGRAVLSMDGIPFIFEALIAGNFAGFLAMASTLYQLGGYHGHVDIGLVVAGLRGGYSHFRRDRHASMFQDHAGYNADAYSRTERVAAAEMIDAEQLARRQLRHLFEATTGRDDFDPFT